MKCVLHILSQVPSRSLLISTQSVDFLPFSITSPLPCWYFPKIVPQINFLNLNMFLKNGFLKRQMVYTLTLGCTSQDGGSRHSSTSSEDKKYFLEAHISSSHRVCLHWPHWGHMSMPNHTKENEINTMPLGQSRLGSWADTWIKLVMLPRKTWEGLPGSFNGLF